jgi:hypothetical protein
MRVIMAQDASSAADFLDNTGTKPGDNKNQRTIGKIVVASDGTVYIAPSSLGNIKTIKNGVLSKLQVEPRFQPGGLQNFQSPSIAVASNGDVYVAESDNCSIMRIKDGSSRLFAGSSSRCGYQNGVPLLSCFQKGPLIAIDSEDNLIVCDKHNLCLRKICNDNVVTLTAKFGITATSPVPDAHVFRDAVDMCAAPNGIILICTPYAVFMVRDAKVVPVLTKMRLSQRIPWATQGLSEFTSIALDPNGTLYVGDKGLGKVWEVRGLPFRARVSLEKGIDVDSTLSIRINGFDLKVQKTFVGHRCPQLLYKSDLQQRPVDHTSIQYFRHILYTKECPPDLSPLNLLGTAVRSKKTEKNLLTFPCSDRVSSSFRFAVFVPRGWYGQAGITLVEATDAGGALVDTDHRRSRSGVLLRTISCTI